MITTRRSKKVMINENYIGCLLEDWTETVAMAHSMSIRRANRNSSSYGISDFFLTAQLLLYD
jgi:hypothetical protein